jgi:sulfur-carrier protein adenylyltransferase/sulfurtransferase
MSKKYLLPVFLFLGFGILLIILPAKKSYNETKPEELLNLVNSSSRFVTPDEVAERMIEKDPSLLLIDVRPSEEYLAYTLPGAINIPLEELGSTDQQSILRQEGMDFIFFSTGSITSDQAWILGKRLGLKNLYVMQGGINLWFDNFFMTSAPKESAPASDLELYQFRLGVRQFFTGGDVNTTQSNSSEPVHLETKAKKSAAEGGC